MGLVKTIVVLPMVLIILTACGPKNNASESASTTPAYSPPTPQPIVSSGPPSGSGTFCGDTLVWADDFVFKLNADLSVSPVSIGEYGYDAYLNGWATPIPACHYKIEAGLAPYME